MQFCKFRVQLVVADFEQAAGEGERSAEQLRDEQD